MGMPELLKLSKFWKQPFMSVLDGHTAGAWIVVGASGLHGEKATFSNYGRQAVDVDEDLDVEQLRRRIGVRPRHQPRRVERGKLTWVSALKSPT